MLMKIIGPPKKQKNTRIVSSGIDYEQADLLTMWVISSSCRNKAGGISVACFDIDMFSNSTLVRQHQHRCIRIISVISSSCRNKAGGISVACFDIAMFSNSSLVSISIPSPLPSSSSSLLLASTSTCSANQPWSASSVSASILTCHR